MVYFAYGSNMCLPRLLSRVKSAQFVEIAKLTGFRIEFHKRSEDKFGTSGKATLFPQEGCHVYGTLFSLDELDIGGLRKAEGWPKHYAEATVKVESLSGQKDAMTYIGTPEYYDENQIPYDWYVDLIRIGGRRLGLPESYISRFDAIRTKPDPDETRSVRERFFLR